MTTTVGTSTTPIYLDAYGKPTVCSSIAAQTLSITNNNSQKLYLVGVSNWTGSSLQPYVNTGVYIISNAGGVGQVSANTFYAYNFSGKATSAGYADSAGSAASASVATRLNTSYGASNIPIYTDSTGTIQSATALHVVPSNSVSKQTISAQTTYTLNPKRYRVWEFTCSAGLGISLDTSSLAAGEVATVKCILHNAGSYTITWPTGIVWAGGRTPLLTTGTDIVEFTVIGE